MKILAIETSCDETAIAVLEARGRKNPHFYILSSVVSSQVKLHAKWGGVVPSLAKREHIKNLPVVLKKALKEAKPGNSKSKTLNSKQIPKIDLIAVVNGPGLEPTLWTGINFAKELAKKWKKPLIPINHMEGHLFSVFLPKENLKFKIQNLKFPTILLLVSGGHTQLVLVKEWLHYKILGETRDDAAGEAFDKVARMLNLGYPGGPIISKLANDLKIKNFPPKADQPQAEKLKISLPRPMIHSRDYDFSFSGLKTAVLYKIKELKAKRRYFYDRENVVVEICREFQQAVINVLIAKTLKAVEEYKAKTIIVAGGVAANKELRRQFQKATLQNDRKYTLLLPETRFAGDNAAMIALAAYFRWQKTRKPANLRTLKAKGNLKIG
jgi:N6-L-threonylcarbamoyladenine synthase